MLNTLCSLMLFDDGQFTDTERQRIRVAALLHDLGHYPLSHAFEHAVVNHYSERAFLTTKGNTSNQSKPAFKHEALGREILENDPQIQEVLARHCISSEEIKAAFSSEQSDSLFTLVSSDLDCDRLDYLMRTSHHAGLPYGNIDVEYLASQATLDSNGQYCFTNKAKRAADHMLISRYFDYTQVVFHKTVVALELILEKLLQGLLEIDFFDCSGQTISGKIANGTWATIDDNWLVELFREFNTIDEFSEKHPILKRYAKSILSRNPPKLVVSAETVSERENVSSHRNRVKQVQDKVKEWAKSTDIPVDRWHIWDVALPLTSIGSKIRYQEGVNNNAAAEADQASLQLVRILKPASPAHSESIPLISCDGALTNSLSQRTFRCIRIYIEFCDYSGDIDEKRSVAYKIITDDLKDFGFE